jgi:hypothetical protein
VTAATLRTQRLLALRAAERRTAEKSLAQAQANLARLTDLSTRLDLLRGTMAPASAAGTALDLRLISAMADQLFQARSALDAPMQAAAALHRDSMVTAQRADARERRLEQHIDAARQAEARAEEQRRDSRRISMRPGARLRLVREAEQ